MGNINNKTAVAHVLHAKAKAEHVKAHVTVNQALKDVSEKLVKKYDELMNHDGEIKNYYNQFEFINMVRAALHLDDREIYIAQHRSTLNVSMLGYDMFDIKFNRRWADIQRSNGYGGLRTISIMVYINVAVSPKYSEYGELTLDELRERIIGEYTKARVKKHQSIMRQAQEFKRLLDAHGLTYAAWLALKGKEPKDYGVKDALEVMDKP